MCMSVQPVVCRDLGHQKLLKHPQNLYSIERAGRKLSKTPLHALIDAVGGPHHHFECTTRALSGPNRPAGTRPDSKASSGGRGGGRSAMWEENSSSPDDASLLPPGPAGIEKSTLRVLKVMV